MRLTELRDPVEIARAVVNELHSAFGYYLAVIHRLDDDGYLRVARSSRAGWPTTRHNFARVGAVDQGGRERSGCPHRHPGAGERHARLTRITCR